VCARAKVNFHCQRLGEITFSEMQTRSKVTRLVEESEVEAFDT
jgi:hypothetical protein